MKLYIIGNGFDKGHGIPCTYSDFYNYLRENRGDVLDAMAKFYCIDEESELWSDFECSLEKDIDYESLSDIIFENTPKLGSEDFRDRDWYDAQIYVENECDDLLDEIRSGFQEWIESLTFSEVCKKYKLENSALYFTFNYTDVLERIYNIPIEDILHIHNKVGDKLVFGHGKRINDFNVKEALYGDKDAFLSKDENGNIECDTVGHEEFAENEVYRFYEKMMKPTETIIKNNSCFFEGLTVIDEIIVLGHSYNNIDYPYFKKIAESVKQNTKWKLYYYSELDQNNAKKMINMIKVNNNLFEYIHC